MKFFTTLSQSQEIHNESLELFLEKNTWKYFLVYEQGKEGTHDHIHIYIDSDTWSSTDSLTRSIRKVYDPQYLKKLDNTRYLVKTKKCKNIDKACQYMMKEQTSYKSGKSKNFDSQFLKTAFKKAGLYKLAQHRVKLTLSTAPYVLVEKFAFKVPPTVGEIQHKLGLLIKEDYIVHHLFDIDKLNKIALAVKYILTV